MRMRMRVRFRRHHHHAAARVARLLGAIAACRELRALLGVLARGGEGGFWCKPRTCLPLLQACLLGTCLLDLLRILRSCHCLLCTCVLRARG